MASVAGQVRDERTARMVLSMIDDPDDPMTGKVLWQVSGIGTLGLLEGDGPVPALDETEAMVWRSRLAPRLNTFLLNAADHYQQRGLGTLIPTDKHWPTALGGLGARQPYLLWTKGATSLLTGRLADRVTITGSRAATHYGEHVAGELASKLSDEDRTVVSGGAYGIEGAAHRSTMAAGGHAVVVMATGIDERFPMMNRDMLNAIGDVGLLITELPPETPIKRHNLLARHRIMAALSGATVLVEAAARSGARNVAVEAASLGRAVGAVPGPVTSAASVGTHDLLRRGTARLVAHAGDVLRLLDSEPASAMSASVVGPEVARGVTPSAPVL